MRFGHSATFGRGIAWLVAFLAWTSAGYAVEHFYLPIPSEFGAMSLPQKAGFLAWLAVAMTLLYFAMTRLVGEASSFSRDDRFSD